MSGTLIRHLSTRALRGKRLVGTCVLAAVAGVAAWVSMAGAPADAAADIYRAVSATVPAATLSIALLIVTSATLRDERDGGTLGYVYMSPVSAAGFAASSMAAGLTAAVVVSLAGWLPGWVGAGVMSGSWSVGVPALVGYLLAAVGYGAVFVPLGYLLDRSLIVGLAYIFVWEGIVATAVTGVGPSSIWRIALSGYADLDVLPPDALDVLGTVRPGVGGALATVVLLVFAGTSVLTWAVRVRDAV